jgi:hypothetical protein
MAQLKFDLDKDLFSLPTFKRISRLPPGTVDVGVKRGLFRGKRILTRKGGARRLYFPVKEIAKGRLVGELWTRLYIVSSGAADLAAHPAYLMAKLFDENWMWAVARGVENNIPFHVSCYASHTVKGWKIDVQFGKPKEPQFGLEAAYMFIPMSEIFADVYRECSEAPDIVRSNDPAQD